MNKERRTRLHRVLKRLTDPGADQIWTPSIISNHGFLPRTDRREPKPRR
jgi:hypothetical protein